MKEASTEEKVKLMQSMVMNKLMMIKWWWINLDLIENRVKTFEQHKGIFKIVNNLLLVTNIELQCYMVKYI
jgi:hypothetical protein